MLKNRISQQEAAEILGVSRATVVRWMKSGILEPHEIGGRNYLTKELIDAFVARVQNADQRQEHAS